MSTEPFIGEVKLFGFYFAPKGHALCQGQLLPIASNSALFSLLGTTYGGDGRTTFALPDLQGRVPIGQGQGNGLPLYKMGQKGGAATTTLLLSNLPAHTHSLANATVKVMATTASAEEQTPEGTFPATTVNPSYSSFSNAYTGGGSVSGTTDGSGSSLSFSILNPILCMNYSIALFGVFPSRN